MTKRRNDKTTGMKLEDSISRATGLYTVREVSRFAGVHPVTLQNWYFGTTGRKPLRQTEIAPDDGKFLTFHEFVEALAIRSLRQSGKASLQKIRSALTEAKEKHGIEYPFSHKTHRTYCCGGEFHILLEEGALTGLTGKDRAQQSFKQCLEQFMEALKFDDKKMAVEYVAYRFGDGDNVITMNPKVYFGEPMVGKTGYTAETLYKAAMAEGSVARAAEFYEVDKISVSAACAYWEQLTRFDSKN